MSHGRDNIDGGLDASRDGSQPDTGMDTSDGMDANHDAGLDTRVGVDASVARSDAGLDVPNVLIPTYRLVNARWLTTPVRCGDEVGLRAVVLGYPSDTPATIEVFAVDSGAILHTIYTNVTGGVIQTRYRVYASSVNWRTDRIKFRVLVPSLSVRGESENELTFRNRPTTNWELINEELRGLNSNPHRIYDQRLEAGRVHISVKLRLTGMTVTSTERLSIKRSIESVWNNGFNPRYKFRRANCQRGANCPGDSCNLDFRLDVNFMETQPHISIEMRDGTMLDRTSQLNAGRRENTSRTGSDLHWSNRAVCSVTNIRNRAEDQCTATIWYYPPAAASIFPHEIGHILGCFDEYFGGGNDPQGYQPYPTTANQIIPPANQTLMSTHGVTTMLPRFYRYFLWFLNQHSGGDSYVIFDTATNAIYQFP